MERRSVQAIIGALNAAGVRYLIAGGLAVVAHGYVRFTADIDLILDLESENVKQAMTALADLGYRPRAPVRLEEFADPAKRDEWVRVREKGLTVLLDFDAAYRSAARMDVAPGMSATFLSLGDLLRLKERARRPQDMLDIEKLRALHKETSGE